MFEWSGLPDTIDVDFLNFTLINVGKICWTKINGKLYALFGNVGGEPNEYYFPTKFIIANPILGSKTVNIGVDGIVMYGSTIERFVRPVEYEAPLRALIDITAQQLTEVTISALTACKNIRAALFVSARDDNTKQAAELALRRIYDGDPATVFKDKVIDSLKIIPNPAIGESAQALKECREQYQFYLGQFYNAIGVSYNTNTKRERLITAEVETADDTLMINIADMLYQRKKACDDINAMFGTSISVDFSEEWKKIDKAMEPEVSPAKQDEGVSENDAVEDADNSGS